MKPGATAGASPLEQHVRSAVAAHRGARGALLPILHDLQATFGYVDQAAIPILADELNLSRADVHGVVSFYHDFRESPAVGTHVRVCRAEACQAAGAEELLAHVRERLATDVSGTLDEVFCFGNCALGPAVEIDGRIAGRVTPQRFDALLERA